MRTSNATEGKVIIKLHSKRICLEDGGMNISHLFLRRQAWRWAFVFGISLLSVSCSQAEPDYGGTTTTRLYRHSVEDVVTLKVPNGYLDHFILAGPPVPGTKEDRASIQHQMYFIAETDTLAPRSKENATAFEFPNSLINKIRFNISTIYGRLPDEVPIALQSTYDSRSSTFSFSCVRPLEPESRFGLKQFETTIANCPRQSPDAAFRKDMLIKQDADGNIQTQIFCTSGEILDIVTQKHEERVGRPNPMCEHAYFYAPLNARVTIHYPRFLLKDWQSLQQRINALLTSFVQTSLAP